MNINDMENMNGDFSESSSFESEVEREERSRFVARLRSLIPEKGENSFARRAGISPSGLRGALKNGNPGRAMLLSIAREAGVRVEWLATGEGHRERDQGAEMPDKQGIQKPCAHVAPRQMEQADLLERFELREVFLISGAIKAIAADLSESDQLDLGARMMQALVAAASSDSDITRLNETDMQALASVVRKLVLPSQ
jgi:hypothetical protein